MTANNRSPIPLDLGAIDQGAGLQEDFAWPLSQVETQALCGGVMRRLTEAVRDIPSESAARLAELVAPRAINFILPAMQGAGLAAAAERAGLPVRAGLPEMRYMLGEIRLEEVPSDHLESQLRLPPPVAYATLRRLARPRYWTPWWRMPGVLALPDVTVANPNDMLQDRIAFIGVRANFIDAGETVRRALAGVRHGAGHGVAEAACDAIIAANPAADELPEEVAWRYRAYVELNVRHLCERMAPAVKAMEKVRQLPQRLWCGTAGNLPTALLASEVLRRGGDVMGFDHVTGRGLERNIEFTALLELPFCNRFAVATEHTAERMRALDPGQLVHRRHNTQIVGNRGYARVRALDLTRHEDRSKQQKPRVTYVSPMFRGWRQSTPASTADPVQLDWELRLVSMLQGMPIDLTCQPHPEGLFEGRQHPLMRMAQVKGVLFEQLLAETDVFLFDWIRTSTFWIALCTDLPIVLIEPGYSLRDEFFTDEIRHRIEERVTFVPAQCDERNRLGVDEDVLRDALLAAPTRVDGSFFRCVLAGLE